MVWTMRYFMSFVYMLVLSHPIVQTGKNKNKQPTKSVCVVSKRAVKEARRAYRTELLTKQPQAS
jgi:hypothetical protein